MIGATYLDAAYFIFYRTCNGIQPNDSGLRFPCVRVVRYRATRGCWHWGDVGDALPSDEHCQERYHVELREEHLEADKDEGVWHRYEGQEAGHRTCAVITGQANDKATVKYKLALSRAPIQEQTA